MMRVGIIGSGRIGGTVGRALSGAGHEVLFSSRHPEELQQLARQTGARTGTPQEAAAFAEVLVLAVPGPDALATARGLGDLAGRVLVDATNQMGPGGARSTAAIDEALPAAKVVKAFNTLGSALLTEIGSRQGDQRLVIFTCSRHVDAREAVDRLVEDAGGVPHDLGDLDQAVLMSPGGALFNREVTAGSLVAVLDEVAHPRTPAPSAGPEDLDALLETFARAVYGAGFRWETVVAKWPGIRRAFHDFALADVASMTTADVDRIAGDAAVIRNRRKIEAIVADARVLSDLAREHGTFAKYLASFPDDGAAATDVSRRFHWVGENTARWIVHSVQGA